MHKSTLIALAVLLGLSCSAQAKGLRFKSSGSSHSSHSHAEPSSGSGTHFTSVRPRSSASSSTSSAATDAPAAQTSAVNKDKLNAELAALRAATPPSAPVSQRQVNPPAAAPLAANERHLSQPVATGKVQAVTAGPPLDVSYLVSRDMAKEARPGTNAGDVVNRRGVNCSLYPTRCP